VCQTGRSIHPLAGQHTVVGSVCPRFCNQRMCRGSLSLLSLTRVVVSLFPLLGSFACASNVHIAHALSQRPCMLHAISPTRSVPQTGAQPHAHHTSTAAASTDDVHSSGYCDGRRVAAWPSSSENHSAQQHFVSADPMQRFHFCAMQ